MAEMNTRRAKVNAERARNPARKTELPAPPKRRRRPQPGDGKVYVSLVERQRIAAEEAAKKRRAEQLKAEEAEARRQRLLDALRNGLDPQEAKREAERKANVRRWEQEVGFGAAAARLTCIVERESAPIAGCRTAASRDLPTRHSVRAQA